jgi:hypothetical protein
VSIDHTEQLNTIKVVLNKYDCILLTKSYENRNTLLRLQCKCGEQFSRSWKNVQTQIRKYGVCNCKTCSLKKWTNETIDDHLSHRSINRIQDVSNISQPSITPIEFSCECCNYTWKATLDNVIHKQSGCPQCAGNLPYTVSSLQTRLNNRTDLSVKNITTQRYKYGTFNCTQCGKDWNAIIHNVIKFNYGCPFCNANMSIPVTTPDGVKFHSKLEYYFWQEYYKHNVQHQLLLQQRYSKNRRLTCDFVIPTLYIWIEISGQQMLSHNSYVKTLHEKHTILAKEKPNCSLVVLSSHCDIIDCISLLKEC